MSSKPSPQENDGEDDREEFDGEGKGLLLNLRRGLKNSDEKAQDHADDDWRSGKDQNQDQRLVAELVNFILETMRHLNDIARPCTRTVHPSTITRSSSLIGNAIVRGESIIIPMASKNIGDDHVDHKKGR